MTKNRFYIIVILFLLLSNLLLVVNYVFMKRRGHRPPQPRDLIIQKLKFDKEQVARYDELISDHRQKVKAQEKQLLELKQELYSGLLNSESLSMRDSLIDQIALSQKQLEKVHIEHFQNIGKICRPDQLKAYRDLLQEIAQLFSHPPHPPRQP